MFRSLLLRPIQYSTPVLAIALGCPAVTYGFPPYRSTDAETADPWTIEARLGLVQLAREANETDYLSPLMRLNFGLPHNVELVSELEYEPADARLSDAAVGAKWVPFMRSTSLGIESLLLLPVSRQGGTGTEVSLLVTYRNGPLRLHLNGGSFYDARPDPVEKGWKASALVEARSGCVRPGFEIFSKKSVDEPAQVQVSPGIILDVGGIDVRTGVRVGVTGEAPDLVASLWVTGKIPLRDPRGG